MYIITYLVSSRPYIEIFRVCKIYGRSGTEEISVLFRRGHLFVYAVLLKIRKIIRIADKLTTSILARKFNIASYTTSHFDVIDASMTVKAYFEVSLVQLSRQKQHYLVLRCATFKT